MSGSFVPRGFRHTQWPPRTLDSLASRAIQLWPCASFSGSSNSTYQLTPITTGVGFLGAVEAVSGKRSTCYQSLGGRRPRGPGICRLYADPGWRILGERRNAIFHPLSEISAASGQNVMRAEGYLDPGGRARAVGRRRRGDDE